MQLIGAVLCLPGLAHADVHIEIDRLSGEAWSIEGLRLDVRESADTLDYALQANRLHLLDRSFQRIEWTCSLTRALPTSDPADGAAQACVGSLRAGGRSLGKLGWEPESANRLSWSQRDARMRWDAGTDAWRIELSGIPLGDWMAALQPSDLPVSWRGGALQGTLIWKPDASRLHADLTMRGLAFDGLDGRAAGEDIAAAVTAEFSLGQPRGWSLTSKARLHAGLWLAGPALFQPPPGFDIDLSLQSDGQGVDSGEARMHDPDVGKLVIQFHRQADQSLEQSSWSLDADVKALGEAWPRYLQGIVDWAGLPGFAAAGRLSAGASGVGGRIDRIDIDAERLALSGASGGFQTGPGKLDLHWLRNGISAPSSWNIPVGRWEGAEFGSVDLGWASSGGNISLTRPAAVTLFGGSLRIPSLQWSPSTGDLSLAAEIADLDLAPLTAWLGWPALEGRLSGSLPAAHYRDETLSFDGGLRAGLLGGQTSVEALRWERPFGVSPSLSADVRFKGLDLEPLTSTFGFGSITGRLDGEILGLRLLDGSPVQFDAKLRTDPNWKGKQRISQRAVNDLSSIGGGGAVAGLQATVLKVFDDFSYRQIGFSCKLERGICKMGGIDSRGGGYTLVEGSGLPRITVNGFQKQVDWSVLVARLKAATSEGGVRVE